LIEVNEAPVYLYFCGYVEKWRETPQKNHEHQPFRVEYVLQFHSSMEWLAHKFMRQIANEKITPTTINNLLNLCEKHNNRLLGDFELYMVAGELALQKWPHLIRKSPKFCQ
jgi:hypothetical protein